MSKAQKCHHLPYSNTGYFSDFICRYLAEDDNVKPLYNRFPSLDDFKGQIEEKTANYNSEFRSVLVDVLHQQYTGVDLTNRTSENILSLRSEDTFTITTGHQLNLFTGPLYFLYKIISVIKLTEQLKERYPDYNFVPMYWMASEDHDFDEINYFNFKGKKIQWSSSQSGAVGPFNTGGLEQVYDVISSEFGSGKQAEQLKFWFKEAYLNFNTLSDATRYLANVLFGQYGLVVIDANSTALKELFIPQLRAELIDQVSFDSVTRTNNYLGQQGLKIQVNPREINLFYMLDNVRERIVLEEGRYTVVNSEMNWSESELLNELKEHPERFSPNVIMRPLYQEVILPNLCYIGGGGEMIYWLQLKSNFEAQKVNLPILLLRNSVLIKTHKQAKKQARLQLTDADLFLKRNIFINKRVRSISNIDIDFSGQIKYLKSQFKELHELAEQTDKSFLGAVKAQEIKQIKGLHHLEKRLLKAQKRKLKDQIERCTDLQEQLFPNGSLQERSLNFSELYLEYGDDLIPLLFQCLDPLHLEFTIIEA